MMLKTRHHRTYSGAIMKTKLITMKKKMMYILLPLTLFGCSNFLDEESKDLLIPKTIENYEEVLYGEVINTTSDNFYFLEYLSDDISEHYNSATTKEERSAMFGYFKWDNEPEVGMNNAYTPNKCWDELYHDILSCNVIIENVSKIKEDESRKNALLGEAHFMRALQFFTLVNIFGEPFINEDQASKALGIPINKETSIKELFYNRSSLKDCYNYVEEDLLKAIEFFKKGTEKQTIFRPTLNTAYLLASRLYLYKKNYEKSIEYSNLLIDRTGPSFGEVKDFPTNEFFFSTKNRGVLFSYSHTSLPYLYKISSGNIYKVSPELIQMISTNDERYKGFFYPASGSSSQLSPDKYIKGTKVTIYGKNLRVEEAYLNRAEAEIMRDNGSTQKALDDINILRQQRIKKGLPYLRLTTDKEQALQWIRDERRMELCFENHRWFDLRRWNVRCEHSATVENTRQTFVLEPGSKKYTLPIPKHVRDTDPNLEPLH